MSEIPLILIGDSFMEGLVPLPKLIVNSLSGTLHCNINSGASKVWVGVSNDEDDNEIFPKSRAQNPEQFIAMQNILEKDW